MLTRLARTTHAPHPAPPAPPCCPAPTALAHRAVATTAASRAACHTRRTTAPRSRGACTAMDAACLMLVPPGAPAAELRSLLANAAQSSYGRVYVITAGTPGEPVTAALLDWLGQLYGATATVDARLDVVPCLPCAGWTPERLATLVDSSVLLAPPALQHQARELLGGLNSARPTGQAVQLQLAANSSAASPAEKEEHAQQEWRQQQLGRQQQQQQHREEELQFENVAVGGTFDRLHAGHRLLLAATALVCTGRVFIGVTSDALLAKKTNRQLLQDFERRRAATVEFVSLVRPALHIQWGALVDPQEPTQAELDPRMHALVVSRETLGGGESINRGRQARGFSPLRLVVVGLVGGEGGAAAKLSSTALREADAAAAAAGGGQAAAGAAAGD